MSRTNLILQLLSLLGHRTVVKLSTVKEVCGVSESAAVHCFDLLAEANIPVQYDHALGGYRLAGPAGMRLDDFSLQEIVLLVTCIGLARRHVNGEYRTTLTNLLRKIVSRQPYPVESPTGGTLNTMESSASFPDYSHEVSLAILQAAGAVHHGVSVAQSGRADREVEEVSIDSPTLVFNRTWQIFAADGDTPKVDDFSNVRFVRIIDPIAETSVS
jgi:predicted DNA-binding transcriptional regulator YafY